MDTFIETLVAKKPTAGDLIKILSIIVGTIVIDIAAFMFSFMFFPVIFIATGVLAWYMVTNLSVEFEYILTNGELDIDKIQAQRKRTRLITVSAKDFDYIKRLTDKTRHEFENVKADKKIIATDNKEFDNIFFAVFNHKTHGKTMIAFQPDERMLEQLRIYCKRNLYEE